ncbi:MAG: sulfotransferase [Frankiaceae bacterium]|nr:sulfotransferase [Frankiaceae bacterium]MBV9869878.1 sulfotransferase [Frankiaceae bacterium]
MALPDFLLIGAPKAGTTALHVALSRHPDLFLSAIKEPKFFLTDEEPPVARGGPGDARTIREQIWRRRDYEALFDGAPAHAKKGESTTLYLRDWKAHRRIHRLIPQAKLVAVLRDPVERAHSNWTHLRSAGLEPESDFVTACHLEAERKAKGWAPFWYYLEQGRYGDHLEHLLSVFPKEQVLVLLYRDYREHPIETVDTVCRFLGVAEGLVTDVPTENLTVASSPSVANNVLRRVIRLADDADRRLPFGVGSLVKAPAAALLQREQRTRSPLTTHQRRELLPKFEADIRRLESLTDRSFSHWLDLHNGVDRPALETEGRFGTAFRSIDRPST